MTNLELQRHQRFWFSDGSLHLLVEDTLYRVHRYLFEMHATNFAGTLNANLSSAGIAPYAFSNQSPYFLEGVKQVDFDRLLGFLYPRDLTVDKIQTPEEWVSILKLASKWGFGSLRAKAVKRIAEFVTPIDKVVLGQEHDIPELLLTGYTALCQSNIPLSQEEGRRLGLEAVINIYGVRQESWAKSQEINPTPHWDITAKIKSFINPTDAELVTPTPTISSPFEAASISYSLRSSPILQGSPIPGPGIPSSLRRSPSPIPGTEKGCSDTLSPISARPRTPVCSEPIVDIFGWATDLNHGVQEEWPVEMEEELDLSCKPKKGKKGMKGMKRVAVGKRLVPTADN